MSEKYFLPQKSQLKQISIEDIDVEKPDLKNIYESKAVAIGKWLMAWIDKDLKSGKIQTNTLIPSKPDFAYYLGVSIGTIQNALRYIEDLGYVESKQCIGTLIKDKDSVENMRKLTSKREKAIDVIKKYIITNNYKKGQLLPSSRFLAGMIDCSPNTTRLALEYLGTQGILEHKFKKNNESGWMVMDTKFEIDIEETPVSGNTLVEKIERDLKDYIVQNLKVGDKLPVHSELSKTLKVSIKTVHDSLKLLIDEGILLARRGRYGTTVIKMPYGQKGENIKKETSIFAPAEDTAFYYYEKTQNHIKKMIAEKYQIGEKLPSVVELSKQLDLSPNTIRKAFHNLAKEGYLVFARGRYGGTFVIDIPQMEEQTFKWLAVNPKYAEVYNNNN
ncbi:GntR family transcriptional regulator [bacterium]|nr:GntR family transcriptional regulator [bacterium]